MGGEFVGRRRTVAEFVEDFEDVGEGKGGWRDDVLHYCPDSADT